MPTPTLSPETPPPPRTLGRRLLLAFAGVLILAGIGSMLGWEALRQIHHATDHMVGQSVATERLVADAYRAQAINAERYKAVALSSEPEVGEVLAADIALTQQAYESLMVQLTKRLHSAQERQMLEQIQVAEVQFTKARTDLVAARDSGLTERIRKVYSQQFIPAATGLQTALATLTQAQRSAIDADDLAIANLSQMAQHALIAFGALAAVLGLVLAVWLVRSISRPMALASATAQRVACLDLRHDIDGHNRDEAGHMLSALALMQRALRDLVGQVRHSAQSIRMASTDIAQGSNALSTRTEETAASLQEAAASLEHITLRVEQSAQAAQRAQSIAEIAVQEAAQGGAVIREVVSTMMGIERSSSQMAEIIGVIDGIAFQTNLLALNAAVEAARAGSHGQGFAVVASEVRALSARSAQAAQDIRALIGASVEQAQSGSRLVHGAGVAMEGIIASIREAAQMMTDITTATEAQNQDLWQVNDAVSRLDQMTQQNSALVEESAAAADSLRVQAQELAALINQFVLPGQAALSYRGALGKNSASAPIL